MIRRFSFRFDSRDHRQALIQCAASLGLRVKLVARRDGAYDVVAEGSPDGLASLEKYPRYTDGVVAVDAVDSPPRNGVVAAVAILLGVVV